MWEALLRAAKSKLVLAAASKRRASVEVRIRIDIESSTVEFTISIPPIVLNVIHLNGGEIGQPKSILG
jgi:hypothetical protein